MADPLLNLEPPPEDADVPASGDLSTSPKDEAPGLESDVRSESTGSPAEREPHPGSASENTASGALDEEGNVAPEALPMRGFDTSASISLNGSGEGFRSPGTVSPASQTSPRLVSDLTKALGKLPSRAPQDGTKADTSALDQAWQSIGQLTPAEGQGQISPSSGSGASDKAKNPFASAAEAAGRAWRGRNEFAAGAREGLVRLTNGGWRAPSSKPDSSRKPDLQASSSQRHGTDAENHAILAQLEKQASSPAEKVSFSALAKDMDLAKAARMEFNFGTSPKDKGMAAGPLANLSPVAQVDELPPPLMSHELEVSRHRAVTADVTADAQAESDLTKEMIALVLERLRTAQKSVAAYGKMLTGMAAAETAYVKAMEVVAREATRPIMATEGSSGLQEGSSSAILQLPALVAKAHGTARAALKDDANALYELDQKFRESIAVISADATQLSNTIQRARHDLCRALETHEGACGAVDALMLGSTNGRPAERVVNDPWITETLLAKAHAHLRDCLQEERSSMDAAYGRLQELELERCALMARLSHGCFEHYKAASITIHDRSVDLAGTMEDGDLQAEVQSLMATAKQASETSRELAERQAENLETVATELFCSPEILRQGLMEIWNSNNMQWVEQHFVLTRSGFLHWFESTDHLLPTDCMNLSRCHIDAGEPPIFNLLEDGHGLWFAGTRQRKVTLKAEDVDDCCEWVIGIREEIASKAVK